MSGGKWWSSGLERQDMDAEIHGETVRTPVPQCDVRKGIQSSTPCAGTPKQWRYINMDEKQPRRTTWAVRTEWTEKKRTGSLRISWKWWPKPPEMTSAADRPPSFNHSVSHIFLLPSFPFPASCPFNRSRIPFHFPSPILFLNPSPFSSLSLVHSVQHFPKKTSKYFSHSPVYFYTLVLIFFRFLPSNLSIFFFVAFIYLLSYRFFLLPFLSFLSPYLPVLAFLLYMYFVFRPRSDISFPSFLLTHLRYHKQIILLFSIHCSSPLMFLPVSPFLFPPREFGQQFKSQ